MNSEIYTLSQELISQALEKGITFSFAESCTGGLLGAAITEIPGASAVFLGSAVTYSNASKMSLLGVTREVLEKYGAVSEQCAIQMALGSKRAYGSDFAISTTGVAGPDGGSIDKPVGTVWFGYAAGDKSCAFRKQFTGNRSLVRESSVFTVLLLLQKELNDTV